MTKTKPNAGKPRPNPIAPYQIRGGVFRPARWPEVAAQRALLQTQEALAMLHKAFLSWSLGIGTSPAFWELYSYTRWQDDSRPYLRVMENHVSLDLPQHMKSLQKLADFAMLRAMLEAFDIIWRPDYLFVAPADWPTMELLTQTHCGHYVGWLTVVPASVERVAPLFPGFRVEPFRGDRSLIAAVEARYTKRNREHNLAALHVARTIDEAGLLAHSAASTD